MIQIYHTIQLIMTDFFTLSMKNVLILYITFTIQLLYGKYRTIIVLTYLNLVYVTSIISLIGSTDTAFFCSTLFYIKKPNKGFI